MKLLWFIISMVFIFIMSMPAYAQEKISWQDCIGLAQKNNPELISAQQYLYQQQASADIVASGFYPQVDANANASRSKSSGSQPVNLYSYGISASQLIFDGFKKINQTGSAQQDIQAALYNYRYISSGVRFALRSAFIHLMRSQELSQVAKEIVDIRRSSLELITLRYQSGLEHKGALLTAQANAAQAEAELASATRGLEAAQRKLCQYIGTKEFVAFVVDTDFAVSGSYLDKPDWDKLIRNHPALLQAIAKKNSLKIAVNSKKADYYPQVLGQAGAARSGRSLSDLKQSWDLGLSLSVPIFEGGLRSAEVDKAWAILRQAEADQLSLQNSLVTILEQSWADLQTALDTVKVEEKTLNAALERSSIAEAQYSTGFISFDNWIIIENDLVNAKKAYLEARINALLAEASWIQAKGEVLEYAQK